MYYCKANYITATLDKKQQTEITGPLDREDCGWYQIYCYQLKKGVAFSPSVFYLETSTPDNYKYPLALLEINLSDYRTEPLDTLAKENITAALSFFRQTDMHLIVRFLYDWEGKGIEKEPDTLSLIKKHMAQTGPILNDFKDMITTTQGIFVGSWAEMHTSRYLSARNMTTLLLKWASVTDVSMPLAVRTPKQYRTIIKEMTTHYPAYKKYGITLPALKKRLGLYNDGMLGSVSDCGTYPTVDEQPGKKANKTIRKKELAFQNELCTSVYNGGEVIHPNTFNDLKNALTDLSKMHISYLNLTYDTAVINKWKHSPYKGKNPLYKEKSGYDYITDHLGYRFIIRNTTLQYEPFQKGDAAGIITIENDGFANLYRTKDLKISLINRETNKNTIIFSNTENTEHLPDVSFPIFWNAGKETKLPYTFSPFDFEDGTYALVLSLTDPITGKKVPFANTGYQETLGGYLLGEITIKR